jgi:Asp-tRNA(Asn)/Glu-tRNA(Gln) amidotransferase A subunit family amidase
LTSTRLTEIYLERIERLNPALKCFVAVTAGPALEQARSADRRLAEGEWLGALHGIPWGCKDILDTAGVATGWGAEPYQRRMPAADATVVKAPGRGRRGDARQDFGRRARLRRHLVRWEDQQSVEC